MLLYTLKLNLYDCETFVTMDNDNHWFMYFDNVEMSNTNDMNLDVVGVDFTQILQILYRPVLGHRPQRRPQTSDIGVR